MKKLILTLIPLLLVLSLCTVFVSAENLSLIVKDATWEHEDVGGYSCDVEFKDDGSAVFSGSVGGTWPCIKGFFSSEQCITVDINEYSLHYDFVVENGQTNISLLFSTDTGVPDHGLSFPISNSALGLSEGQYEAGSGDILPGIYQGNIKLTDLIEAVTNLDKVGFDKTYVSEDGKLIFSGLKVYSVSGGVITLNALELVPNSETTEPGDDFSEAESEPEPVSEPEATSEATSEAASEPTTGATSEATSEASVAESTASTGSTPDTGNSTTGIIIAVVLGVLAIAGAVVVVKVRH